MQIAPSSQNAKSIPLAKKKSPTDNNYDPDNDLEDPDQDGIYFRNSSNTISPGRSEPRPNKQPTFPEEISESVQREDFATNRTDANLDNVRESTKQRKAGTSKNNWFLSPPEVPWLNSLGRGVKDTAKGTVGAVGATVQTGGQILSSPEFWNVVGTGAAIYGNYELNKRYGPTYAPGYSRYPYIPGYGYPVSPYQYIPTPYPSGLGVPQYNVPNGFYYY